LRIADFGLGIEKMRNGDLGMRNATWIMPEK
jgi:hypothetical protein